MLRLAVAVVLLASPVGAVDDEGHMDVVALANTCAKQENPLSREECILVAKKAVQLSETLIIGLGFETKNQKTTMSYLSEKCFDTILRMGNAHANPASAVSGCVYGSLLGLQFAVELNPTKAQEKSSPDQ